VSFCHHLASIVCRGWNFLSHLTSPRLIGDDFLLARQIQILALVWRKRPCFNFCWGYNCFVITVRSFKLCYLLTWKIMSYFADLWLVDLQYFQVLLLLFGSIECRGSIKAVWSDCSGFFFIYSQLPKGYIFLYYTSLAYLWFFIFTPHPFFFFKYYLLWFNITQIVIIHICVVFSRRETFMPICSTFQLSYRRFQKSVVT
jgi:hypothetical protein